jgi:protein-tyrosine phosphatase
MENVTKLERIKSDVCAEVVPGLWIGSLASLQLIDNHERNIEMKQKVWSVISLVRSEKLASLYYLLLSSSSTLLGNRHEVWRLSDTCRGELLSERLIPIFDMIDEATVVRQGNDIRQDRACLVHCARGVSRSAALCAAWLISRRHMSLEQALNTLRSVRPQISPNLGFIASLRALEQCEGDVQKAIQRMKSHLGKGTTAN